LNVDGSIPHSSNNIFSKAFTLALKTTYPPIPSLHGAIAR